MKKYKIIIITAITILSIPMLCCFCCVGSFIYSSHFRESYPGLTLRTIGPKNSLLNIDYFIDKDGENLYLARYSQKDLSCGKKHPREKEMCISEFTISKYNFKNKTEETVFSMDFEQRVMSPYDNFFDPITNRPVLHVSEYDSNKNIINKFYTINDDYKSISLIFEARQPDDSLSSFYETLPRRIDIITGTPFYIEIFTVPDKKDSVSLVTNFDTKIQVSKTERRQFDFFECFETRLREPLKTEITTKGRTLTIYNGCEQPYFFNADGNIASARGDIVLIKEKTIYIYSVD
jgi:hypothetical protein